MTGNNERLDCLRSISKDFFNGMNELLQKEKMKIVSIGIVSAKINDGEDPVLDFVVAHPGKTDGEARRVFDALMAMTMVSPHNRALALVPRRARFNPNSDEMPQYNPSRKTIGCNNKKSSAKCANL